MRILALETATLPGSFALWESAHGGQEYPLGTHERAAECLVARLASTFQERGWRLQDLTAVGLTVGPGSYTGVRIGVAIAKMIAYAAEVPVVAVDTTDAIAAGIPWHATRLHVVLDAQRSGVYAALFDGRESSGWVRSHATELMAVDAWLSILRPTDLVVGSGIAKVTGALPVAATILDARLAIPKAERVATLAATAAAAGNFVDAWKLMPEYIGTAATT